MQTGGTKVIEWVTLVVTLFIAVFGFVYVKDSETKLDALLIQKNKVNLMDSKIKLGSHMSPKVRVEAVAVDRKIATANTKKNTSYFHIYNDGSIPLAISVSNFTVVEDSIIFNVNHFKNGSPRPTLNLVPLNKELSTIIMPGSHFEFSRDMYVENMDNFVASFRVKMEVETKVHDEYIGFLKDVLDDSSIRYLSSSYKLDRSIDIDVRNIPAK